MAIKKRIHVNQHHMKANTKAGNKDLPIYTIKSSRGNQTAHEVMIDGPSWMEYHPEKPLACGAKCWIETKSIVYFTHTSPEGDTHGVIN